MLEWHVSFLMDLMILKPFSFKFVALIAHFWVFVPFFYINELVMLRKSACLFVQVQTKIYLPESPFLKNSLAGASMQVLMSNPNKDLRN